MIFRAEEVTRRGSPIGAKSPYTAYNVYAEEKSIGTVIRIRDDMWIVPWPELQNIAGKRSFASLKDAARHIYVAMEKRPDEHRDWSVQMSMQFLDSNKEKGFGSVEDSQIAMRLMRSLRSIYEAKGISMLSLSDMMRISGMKESDAERAVRNLVSRGILTPRVGKSEYKINIRPRSLGAEYPRGWTSPKRDSPRVKAAMRDAEKILRSIRRADEK